MSRNNSQEPHRMSVGTATERDPIQEGLGFEPTHVITRLIMAMVAMIVAVGWAGAATGGCTDSEGHRLQRRDARRDASGAAGRSRAQSAYEIVRGLRRDSAAARLGGRTVGPRADTRPSQAGAHRRRSAGEHDALYDSGRSLDFAATFTADPFQHVGFGDTFDDARGPCSARAAGRCPRAFTPGRGAWRGDGRTRRSRASIRWSSTTTASSGRPPRSGTSSTAPWWPRMPSRSPPRCDRSPATSTGRRQRRVEYLDLYPSHLSDAGTFTSRVFDAGDGRATWRTLTAELDTPPGPA